MGLAYKKNVSDLRNSPGLRIFQKLIDASFNVEFNDKYVPNINYKRKNHLSIKSIKRILKNIKQLFY